MLLLFDKTCNDKVDDSEGKDTNNKTDDAVEDGVFGFFNFTSVTRRSHVADTTNNNDDNIGCHLR